MNTEVLFDFLTYGFYGFIVLLIIHVAWTLYQNHLIKKMNKTGVLLEVVLERDTEKDPLAVEQLWASLHGLYLPWYKRFNKAQPYVSFEIKSENDMSKKKREITFNFWVPEDYKPFLKQRLLGLYPSAQITEIPMEKDYIPDENDRLRVIETVEVGLYEDSAFSLKTFRDYESADPLSAITASLTELENKEIAVIQLVARPHNPNWRKRAGRILDRFERTGRKPSRLPEWTNAFRSVLVFFFAIVDGLLGALFHSNVVDPRLDTKSNSLDRENQKEMLQKAQRYPFSFQIRVLVGSPYGREQAKRRIHSILSSFKELDGSNSLKKEFIAMQQLTYKRIKNRYLSHINNDDILSTVELASFAHLPNKNNFTPGLKKIQSKQAENPVDIAKENAFGVANFRGQKRFVGLDEQARMRHIYISGMTGVGKSVLLENMIINDIENGRGCIVIDPHGELVDVILEKISSTREDIFVLDPSDLAYPFGMNLLEISTTDPIRREMEKVLVVDAYITVMKRVFGAASIGANTDDLFRMSCSAILDHPEGGGLTISPF